MGYPTALAIGTFGSGWPRRVRSTLVDVPDGFDDATPVLAHLMLGSLTALTGALHTLTEQRGQLDAGAVDSLLGLAEHSAGALTQSLRALAVGAIAEAISALAPGRAPVTGR